MENESIQEKSREFSELTREAQEVLEQIDMKTLEDIFSEKLAKAGVEETRGRLCEKEYMLMSDGTDMFTGPETAAEASIKRRIIRLNLPEIALFDAPFRSALLSLITHEEGHLVVNGKACEGNFLLKKLRSFFSSVPFPLTSTGNMHGELRRGVSQCFFEIFNEVVNDKLAEEVFYEYLKRTGSAAFYKDDETEAKFSRCYPRGHGMVETFIEKLSELSGVEKAKAWEAIQGHNIRGEDLRTTELALLFAEYFGDEFLNMLALASNSAAARDVEYLLKHLNPPSFNEDQAVRFKEWGEKRLMESGVALC